MVFKRFCIHSMKVASALKGLSQLGGLAIKEINQASAHCHLDLFLTFVVWTCHSFENYFVMKHKFSKYLKEGCRSSSDERFSFKYFLNFALVREISSKLSCGDGWVYDFKPRGSDHKADQLAFYPFG